MRLSRIRPSTLLAFVAVIMSLGGGAYAATRLAANSVGTAQLKNGAVTGAKVKDGSLSAADFGAPPVGEQGPSGPAGPKGDNGAQGPRGDKGDTGSNGANGTNGTNGIDGAAGAAGLNWKGAWSGSTAYAVDDAVTFSGSSYRRKAAGTTSTNPANDAGDWDLLASKGTDGTNGTNGLTWKGTWSSSTSYAVNDAVTSNGSSYRRKVAGTTAGDPASDSTNWELIAAKGDAGAAGAAGGILVSATYPADGVTHTLGTFGLETLKATCSQTGNTTSLIVTVRGSTLTVDGWQSVYSGARGSFGTNPTTTLLSGVQVTADTNSDSNWITLAATRGNANMLAAGETANDGTSSFQVNAAMSVDGGAAADGSGAACRIRNNAIPLS